MRFTVLTREPRLYSIRRFMESSSRMGHRLDTMDVKRTFLSIRQEDPGLCYDGEWVEPESIDCVLPRIGASVTEEGCNVVRQLESMQIPTVNGSRAILRSRDKLRALQFLSRLDCNIPATVCVNRIQDIPLAIQEVGGFPLVLKLLQGTQGIGVMLVESQETLESMLQAFWNLGHQVLLQEFIAESKGKDVRALVVGDRVITAMRRQAQLGEFRSNIHRGGTGREVQLDPDTERTLVEAAQALELGVCGVDYLESKDGPSIIELNSSPGFQGLEQACPVDVARHILQYMEQMVREARA